MTAAAIASVAWTISARHDVRQHVAQRDAPRRIADRARGEDEVLGLDRQRLPARQPDEHRRGRDADRDHRVGEARAEKRGQRDREDQERAREHGVGQPRDQHVGPAAGVAREQADRHADRRARSAPRPRPRAATRARPRSRATSTSRPISSVPNQCAARRRLADRRPARRERIVGRDAAAPAAASATKNTIDRQPDRRAAPAQQPAERMRARRRARGVGTARAARRRRVAITAPGSAG